MIIPFPGARRVEATRRMRAVLVAGVDDDLATEVSPVPVPMDAGPLLCYFTRRELLLEGREPDLWIERPAPSAPDRSVLLRTLAEQTLEQDRSGRLWLDEGSLDAGVLVACAPAATYGEALALGRPVALLCMHRGEDRCAMSVLVIGPVLWVFQAPTLLASGPVLEGWKDIANVLWRERAR